MIPEKLPPFCKDCPFKGVEYRTTGYGMPVKEQEICTKPDECQVRKEYEEAKESK